MFIHPSKDNNYRMGFWAYTSYWGCWNLTYFILCALYCWFDVYITENLFFKVLFGSTSCFVIASMILSGIYDKRFKYDKKCAQANNDMQWLKSVFRREVLIIVIINAIATTLFIVNQAIFYDVDFPRAN